eukprot:CAMPEP_0194258508 /NCGR_PEP_ID=MMETSP0158-20130606/41486_1 /TAXON_ID=33649 /ORGANISM="Thalassionema nitzschioides, Strain L26-B" /LENGTH=199 /DNA_ID=CAMNT_0038997963 /DNA_START=96 /DNA_END=692 /DNA_ORIENTATION=+
MILRHFILLSLFIIQVLSQNSVIEQNNPFRNGTKAKSKKVSGYKSKKQNGYGKKGKKTKGSAGSLEEDIVEDDASGSIDDIDERDGDDDDHSNDDDIVMPTTKKSRNSKKSSKKGPSSAGEGIKGKKVSSNSDGVESKDWDYICEDDDYECEDGTIVTRDEENECKFEMCPSDDSSIVEGVDLKTYTINNASTSTSISS